MEKNKFTIDKFLSIVNKVLSLVGIIVICIILFPIIFKSNWLKKRLKDIFNPNKITGNAEFRESHESTKQEPKIEVKVDDEWKVIDLDPDQKKKPVSAVFVSKDKNTGKVEVEIKHEKVDRKNPNSSSSSKSALDHLRSGKKL